MSPTAAVRLFQTAMDHGIRPAVVVLNGPPFSWVPGNLTKSEKLDNGRAAAFLEDWAKAMRQAAK